MKIMIKSIKMKALLRIRVNRFTWHMFSFMEAGPPRSPMIFLEGKSGSSHSDKSSFMEEKL